jgi:hypothetical protein
MVDRLVHPGIVVSQETRRTTEQRTTMSRLTLSEQLAKHIKKLASRGPKTRAKALTKLRAVLIVPGEILSGSGPVAADLLAAIGVPKHPATAEVLVLVADMVCADHKGIVSCGLDPTPGQLDRISPGFEAVYHGPAGHALRSAVEPYHGAIVDRLTADDDAVCAAAAFVLAFLPASMAREPLTRALDRQCAAAAEPALLLGLTMSVALSCRYEKCGLPAVVESLATHDSELVRAGAALAQLYLGDLANLDDLPSGAVAALHGAIGRKQLPLELFPWKDGRIDQLVVVVISDNMPHGKRRAAGMLARVVSKLGADHEDSPTWAAGAIAIGLEQRGKGSVAAELDDEERAIVVLLTTLPGTFGGRGASRFETSTQRAFLFAGPPWRIADRRRWLGIDPPGPMDSIIEITLAGETFCQPLARTIVNWQLADRDERILFEALRQVLSSFELLLLCHEASRRVHYTQPFERDQIFTLLAGLAVLRGDDRAAALCWGSQLLEQTKVPADRSQLRGGHLWPSIALFMVIRLGSDGQLDARYDPLIFISGKATQLSKELLLALPLERRERVLLEASDDHRTLDLARIAPFFEHCPTLGLLTVLLQWADPNALLERASDERVKRLLSDVVKPLGMVAAAHPELAELWDAFADQHGEHLSD